MARRRGTAPTSRRRRRERRTAGARGECGRAPEGAVSSETGGARGGFGRGRGEGAARGQHRRRTSSRREKDEGDGVRAVS